MKSRLLTSTLASIFSIKNKVTRVYSPDLQQYSQVLVFLKLLLQATNIIAHKYNF